MKILLATSNEHKLYEMRNILNGHEIIGLCDLKDTDDVIEDGTTFEENAYIKANYFYNKYHMNVLADDSGIVVDALGGAPGIYSSRYAGEDCNQANNRKKIFEELKDVTDRSARFVCSLCFISEEGEVNYFTANCEGYILYEETGDKGFGYDCMFYSTDINKCFGLASEEEKDSVSHRGRAARKFLDFLNSKNW